MHFAIDEHGYRVKPFPKGRATCALCKADLIAHCGEIYSWHWQHSSDRDCDPWMEHETEWHRRWKAKFPDTWQEVIIENTQEKHIADVLTDKGVVIEFQNSSISSSVIRIREAFYGNMIWVINANTFKDNFSIRSIVNRQLKNLEVEYSMTTSYTQSIYDEDIKKAEKKIRTIESQINTKRESIGDKQAQIHSLNADLLVVDDSIDKILDKWTGKSRPDVIWSLRHLYSVEHLEKEYKTILSSISDRKSKLNTEHENMAKSIAFMESLEQINVNDTLFRVVHYELIQKDKLHLFKAIEKSSIGSLFIQLHDIPSEYEYMKYAYRQKEYLFVVDLKETIQNKKYRMKALEQQLIEIEVELPQLKPELIAKLEELIKLKINENVKAVASLNDEWDDLIVEVSKHRNHLRSLQQDKDDEENQMQADMEREKKEKKSKIMREKKGLYTFDWKHERKTWKAANVPLFFDIGEDYLFQKVNQGVFKKVSITDFLSMYVQSNDRLESNAHFMSKR